MRARAAIGRATWCRRLRPAEMALATVLACAPLMAGCGYTLVRADAVPSDVRTVHVVVEAPQRSDPLLADALSREIRRVMRSGGRLQPVERGNADAELVLRITHERLRAVAFDEFDNVLDYQVTIAVDAELRREGNAVLWSAERIAATRGQAAVTGAVVVSSSEFQGTEVASRRALRNFDTEQLGEERKAAARQAVMRDLAETVYARMTEGL